jgi:amidase
LQWHLNLRKKQLVACEKLSSGKYTEQLVQLYLDRIETIDKNGLELHSIINSELAIAKTMDAESG